MPSHKSSAAVAILPLLLLVACGGEDYGEALCQAQLDQPDPCDFSNACSAAIRAATEAGGACEAELAAVASTMPPDYLTCFNACPVARTCELGAGATVELRSCSCQFDCVANASEEYSEAVAVYADCLEADAAVASSCL